MIFKSKRKAIIEKNIVLKAWAISANSDGTVVKYESGLEWVELFWQLTLPTKYSMPYAVSGTAQIKPFLNGTFQSGLKNLRWTIFEEDSLKYTIGLEHFTLNKGSNEFIKT